MVFGWFRKRLGGVLSGFEYISKTIVAFMRQEEIHLAETFLKIFTEDTWNFVSYSSGERKLKLKSDQAFSLERDAVGYL